MLVLFVISFLFVVFTHGSEVLDGPNSPAEQPQWLANITQYRQSTLNSINFDPSVYNNYLPWTTSFWIAPQSHLYDRFLYDVENNIWTVDVFLNDLESRYGGIDGVLLWASYPNLGVDEMNQFDVLSNLPGGLPKIKEVIQLFHNRGVRVFIPYNPWDTQTRRPNSTDDVVLADLAAIIGADGFNGDTMSFIPESFWNSSVNSNNPLAIQPEGGPTFQSVAYSKMGWGYWPNPFIPPVDLYKWVVRGSSTLLPTAGHFTNICNRWSTNHTSDLQQAFFNGIGFVSWENIWGIWNGMTPRDSEATRRVGALLRFCTPYFTTADWEPHTVIYSGASDVGLFASRWTSPGGIIYSKNSTIWTIVNRGSLNYSGATVFVECVADDPTTVYYDLYNGLSIVPIVSPDGNGCVMNLSFVEGGGFGAIISVDTSDMNEDLLNFVYSMQNMTKRSLSSYSAEFIPLPQTMRNWGTTTPASTTPNGTTYIPGNVSWTFTVSGTEIEPIGRDMPGVDVQFPWESISMRNHPAYVLNISSFYMDTTPVTNAQYSDFLQSSGYVPADTHNFLYDWNCTFTTGQPCVVPNGWENKPVTWVSMEDALAYCTYNGKRLPNDYEWQYAVQGPNTNYNYPWGTSFDQSRVPVQNNGTYRGPPPDVNSYPSGNSVYGVTDLMGLVWQWTNEFIDTHTRAGLVRGGSYYAVYMPQSLSWYFPGSLEKGTVNAMTHNKLLLMSPSYDRHGTVGFRCVVDAVSN